MYQPLPEGIRSARADNRNGLDIHYLEAGDADAPVLLLLHGFPELSYSWRKVMLPLAEAGYRVIAPDQRGYGFTTGWDGDYDGDLGACRMFNLATDMVGLLHALKTGPVRAVVGHDFGSPVAAHCALIRPDLFRAAVLMSAPYGGPPPLRRRVPASDIHADLAALPRPRKHYQRYYASRAAAADMLHAPQGLQAFFRAYYHVKSADWPENRPFELGGWRAAELAKMPTYYIMDRDRDMAETVAPHMPSDEEVEACRWLPGEEMAVYARAFRQTGFQCALNWYRCMTDPALSPEMRAFAGARIAVPATFIAGAQDWGIHQVPGALKAMAETATADWRGTHLIEGAGHWVQQEQPAETVRLLLDFLKGL
ncbi:MAG: alpha/beta fold hydrolase [Minwuia sp.]|uniref:alpha/beta hydrolase n=1 Tax=Minwuia sp. TaxID=2493630 RepID=UPI003A86C017